MAFGRSVGSFGDLAQIIQVEFDELKKETVSEIYNELVTPGVTPRDTGTLVWSWRAGPVTTMATPEYRDYEGYPAKINMDKYEKNWSKFYIYNNQPYLNKVNDMNKYMEFVQGAVHRATDRVNGRA